MTQTHGEAAHVLPSLLLRTGVLTLTWWILANGDPASLGLGLPVSVAAAALSIPLAPPRRTGLRLAGVLPYAVYFVSRSVAGGLDVARRALAPALPIDPALVAYRIRLTGVTSRVLFANTISLLPGTLSARIDGDILHVHALDASSSIDEDLRTLEARVGALFGQQLGGGASA